MNAYLSIGRTMHAIIYGRASCFFLPCVWYTFYRLGHVNVSIMQASLEEWIEAGGPTMDDKPAQVPRATNIATKYNTKKRQLQYSNQVKLYDQPLYGVDL
jgi:3-mercaptopyruvate sulfurtransferase SseA